MVAHLSPPEPGKTPRYPWDEWLDGQEWTLMRGRDYWGSTGQMKAKLHGATAHRGVRAVILVDHPDLLAFKAVPREGVAQ